MPSFFAWTLPRLTENEHGRRKDRQHLFGRLGSRPNLHDRRDGRTLRFRRVRRSPENTDSNFHRPMWCGNVAAIGFIRRSAPSTLQRKHSASILRSIGRKVQLRVGIIPSTVSSGSTTTSCVSVVPMISRPRPRTNLL